MNQGAAPPMPLRASLPAFCAALALIFLTACEEQADPAATPSTSTTSTQQAAPLDPQPASEPADTPRVAALLPFAADQLIALGVQPVLVPALRGCQPEAWQGI